MVMVKGTISWLGAVTSWSICLMPDNCSEPRNKLANNPSKNGELWFLHFLNFVRIKQTRYNMLILYVNILILLSLDRARLPVSLYF